ncbi:exo-rhamnogalacturonan lyase family protein [Massilia glaciei]|uniref:Tat pathway signal sequence domain protein n=1 Tax=Massilia glaciei TaxID=1524097 RepID=A0A2U2HK09_9BURK|nr:Tat pathway signal sequence domain protein [Massilia glaciei]PWF47813.1 Tat pathway signal sequence domain protein [Massilia glaciei]
MSFLSLALRACAAALIITTPVLAQQALAPAVGGAAGGRAQVTVNWVGDAPPLATGVSWGVPWPQGAVPKSQAFALTGPDGKALPVQTWPLAFWPDGSLKFSGFATVAQAAGPYVISAASEAAPAAPAPALSVQQGDGFVDINTGATKVRVGTRGTDLIQTIFVDGREVARAGRLVGLVQQGPDPEEGAMPARQAFASTIDKFTIEQRGPVRAVIKVEGKHKLAKGGRAWLPFSLRLYFYAGDAAIHVVHTFIYDGNQQKDFIRGLGLRFTVPMREEVYNRHVAFSGRDGGLWMESLQPGDLNADLRQVAGQKIEGGRFYGVKEKEQLAIWNDYKLVQPSPNGFNIVKRTGAKSTWVFSDAGTHASGLAFVGDVSGGLGVSVKDFWQSFPTAFDVRNAAGKAAELTAWLWSPEAPAMDMRHYATRAYGLSATYEDVQEGMSQAYGVARTSAFTLYPSASVPARAQLAAMAKAGSARALLAASPAYLQSAKVFGVWSPVDRSTPARATIEDRLDSVLAFYRRQQHERHWYGFWTYGDVMHSYNFKRHVWNYDHGGFAWDSTELGSVLWLWTSYLRSGSPEVFRMAEAMARNTSETNVYHLGPMKGLGSRHNVVKWGDGSKEARISQAAHWRPFYYLTTDERIGDVMRDQLESDKGMVKFDPMRLAQPVLPQDPKYPGRIRIGPDWYVLAGNWMTEWERSGDPKWRDRINAGVDSILQMPYWLRSGVLNGLNPDLGGRIGPLKGRGSMTVGYDPATGKLFPIPDPIAKQQVPVLYNLATIQGGAQVMFELVPLLGREDFAAAWLQFARLGEAPGDVLIKDKTTGTEGADGKYVEKAQGGPRLAAYAYAQTGNPAFAKIAIDNMIRWRGAAPLPLQGPDVLSATTEAIGVSTNDAAQSGLTMIESLALLGDALPHALPPPPQSERRRQSAPAAATKK